MNEQRTMMGAPVGTPTLNLCRGREDIHTITENEVVVGRGWVCQVHVPDPTASRIHATLTWDAEYLGWYVEDIKSKNGTFLNGQAIGPGKRMIVSGDILIFGSTGFVVRIDFPEDDIV